MFSDSQLRTILPGLPRIPMRGPWYRCVAFEHLKGPPPGSPAGSPIQPIWPGGSRRSGVRFTPKDNGAIGFDSLYLTCDEMTPLLEVTQVLKPPGSPVPLLFEPQIMMTVDGVLTDLVDISDLTIQKQLGTTHSELTGDWAIAQADYLAGRGPMPPTQALGQAAYDAGGIVGLKYRSSKNLSSGFAIVVFTDRLDPAKNSLRLYNKTTGSLQQQMP